MSIYDSPVILGYCCFLAAGIGAVMGAFLHCTAYRVARGKPFTKGRSCCPVCNHELSALDLVPVISYLALRGRCRYCRTRIPVRYVLAECFFAVMTVLCLLRFDLTVLCLRNFCFGCCLFCLSLTDLESMRIPNSSLLIALAAWLIALPFIGEDMSWTLWHLVSMLLYGGAMLLIALVMDRVLGRESMGGGDIKLFGVTALYLGLVSTLFTVLLACLFGLAFAGLIKKRGKAFPFGPSIAAAAWIMLLYGDGLVNWYISLLG